MENEVVEILRVDTGQAVKSVGDLRENIRLLNKQLNGYDEVVDGAVKHTDGLTIGTEEYNKAIKDLNENQQALRNAMNGTTASMDDVLKAAKGIGTTYNSLVAQMKSMKQEIRTVDVSTEEGAQRFKDLAAQINGVNDQLKAMDADMGNYQRNVGNYTSVWDGFGKVVQQMPPFMNNVKQAGENLHKSFGLLATNPVMGTLTLLLPLVFKLGQALKEDEKVTGSFNAVLKALEPVMDVMRAVFDKVAEAVASVVEWFAKLIESSRDTFRNIIAGAVGVGNVILQYLLGPIKITIEAFKGLGQIIKDVFTGNFKDVKATATAAFDGIKEAFNNSFSFAENYQKGRDVANAFLDGIGSSKKKAQGTGAALAKDVADGFDVSKYLKDDLDAFEDYDKYLDRSAKERKALFNQQKADVDDLAKTQLAWNALLEDDEATRAANAYEIQRAANERRLELLRQYQQDAEDLQDWDGAAEAYKAQLDLEVQMEQDAYAEKKRLEDLEVANTKKAQASRVAIFTAAAGAISSLLGTVADAYEEEAEGSEEAAKKVKALRITAGIIDTISGALMAYTQAMQLGPIAGPIVGAIQAAAVTAAGIAQIAKIKSTKVGSGDSAGSGATVPQASVPAPATSVDLPEVRNVTTASEEDRLDRMASSNRVYILNSDLEANEDYHRTQVAEATF